MGGLFIIPVHKAASLAVAVWCGYGALQTGLQTGRRDEGGDERSPQERFFPVRLPFPRPGHRTLKWIGGVSGGWEWQKGAFRGRQRRSRAFRA
jgi:hypothetical protein